VKIEIRISRKDFLKLIWRISFLLLLSGLVKRTSFEKAYPSSSDTAELQSLINSSSAIAGTNEIILRRNYSIEETIYLRSNITIRGSLPNAETTITMNDKAGRKHIFSGRSVENIKLSNLTFDLNLTAQQVDFRGTENHPLSNITVEDCIFKRLGKGSWGLAIDYDHPESAAPSNYNTNILVKNCLFDGTGAKAGERNRLELAIFSNCHNLEVTQSIFQNVPAEEKDAGLSIYGYCRDVIIYGNRFMSNVSDMYIQQATSIIVENNYFSSQVRIMDSRSIIMQNNDIQNLQIIDFDSPQYDTNTSQYRGSRDIRVSGNKIDTTLGGGVEDSPAEADHATHDSAVELRLHNNIDNMPKNIEISGNQVICSRSFVLMKDIKIEAKDYVDNLRVSKNSVIKTWASINQGIVELRTIPDVPNHGLNDCSLEGNNFTKSSTIDDDLPWDVLITTLGATNLSVDASNNFFNNLGVKIGT
jgi:hypothetical protein